jgi:sugar lactone lactonase YvrE
VTSVAFSQPEGIAVDSFQNVLVGEGQPGKVWFVDAGTSELRLVADGLSNPKGVAFGPGGRSAYLLTLAITAS